MRDHGKEREREEVYRKMQYMHNVQNESSGDVSVNLNFRLRSRLKYILQCNIYQKLLKELRVHCRKKYTASQFITLKWKATFK